MSGFQEIVEKIIREDSFRDALVADPAATLQAEGIVVTPEIIAAFDKVDAEALKSLAENFNESDAAR